MKPFIICIVSGAVLGTIGFGTPASAQTPPNLFAQLSSAESAPQDLKNFFETVSGPVGEIFNRTKELRPPEIDFNSVPFLQRTAEGFKGALQSPESTVSYVSGIIEAIQDIGRTIRSWLADNFNIRIEDVVRGVGDFILWAVGMIVQLINWIFSLIR